MIAKPVVDGIERELADRARVVRLSMATRTAQTVADLFGVRAVPTLIVFDGNGQPVLTQVGRLGKAAVLDAID